ncbi:MAG: hypothetical protein RL750_741, partial [Bacteroidota bacterium]
MRLFFLLLLSCLVPSILPAQSSDVEYMKANYDVFEYRIPMRDGAKLFTLVYVPKDRSKAYPILLNRTCYNASDYRGFNTGGHPSRYLVRDGYILAFQDVRGRYMSDGEFNNMTPNIP